MHKTRRRWAIVLVAVWRSSRRHVATTTKTTTANSSSTSSSSSSAAGASIDYSKLDRHAERLGLQLPGRVRPEGHDRVRREGPSGVTLNYTKTGSAAGKTDLANQVVQFAGTDSTDQGRRQGRPSRAASSCTSRPSAAPITVSFNLAGVDKLKLSRDDARRDLRRARSRRGTTRRSRPTTPVPAAVHADRRRAPLRRLGHDEQLHQVPEGGRARRLDARFGRHRQLAGHDPGRREEQRRGLAHQATDGAIGYVDLADAVKAA